MKIPPAEAELLHTDRDDKAKKYIFVIFLNATKNPYILQETCVTRERKKCKISF